MERACEVCEGKTFREFGHKNDHTFTRCDTCGLERIDPPPTDETLERIYGEHYYDAWGLKRDHDAVAKIKRQTFERVVSGAGSLKPGARVLDLGAATGFLLEVAKEQGFEVYGLELSEFGAAEIARKFGKDRVFRGQLEDASFEGAAKGSFDAIFMCDYIEHVRDPRGVLDLVYEWLAPGGVAAITTPRLDSLSRKLMGMGWTHYKTEHLYYFSNQALERLMKRAGFTNYRGKSLVKSMTADYIAHQFRVYPHPLLSQVAKVGELLPEMAREASFPILMGDLLAYAEKPR